MASVSIKSGRKGELVLADWDCHHHTVVAISPRQAYSGLGFCSAVKREHLRSIELERGICRTPRGEVGGQCLILIKRARLIVFGNPVCHGRYAEGALWHRLTYGPACCLPIQPPQHMLSTVGLVPRALFARGVGPPAPIQPAPISTNRLPNLQACLRYSKRPHYSESPRERKGEKGGR